MPLRVLIIQSEPKDAQELTRFFKERGDEVWGAWNLGQADGLLDQIRPGLIVLDIHLPDSEWTNFLKRATQRTGSQVIVTSRHPDMTREMMAQSAGVSAFLRAPFKPEWIERALGRMGQRTVPRTKPILPKVRTPVRLKITVPYLLLSLLLALGVAFIVSQVVVDSAEERYLNQLIETSRQSADWMVSEEDRLLITLRLVANSSGVAEAIQAGSSETLRAQVLPLAANAREESIEILDLSGTSLLSIRQTPGEAAGVYSFTRGDTTFQTADYVLAVLQGQVDNRGDKFAGLTIGPWGRYFYVSGPVFNPTGQMVGVVLVGRSLDTLAREMRTDTLGEITFYGVDGQPLASTLYHGADSFPISVEKVGLVLAAQDVASQLRDLTVSSIDYAELLGPWEVRDGRDLGVLGVTQPKAFLIQTSRITRWEIFVFVVAAVMLVVGVGFYLASIITRPLQRLMKASNQVAEGNLEVKVDVRGDDEVAVLAHSFNTMIAGLQEGSIYRDLLGRTVSPEVREQLRQTFSSGNLRLEGQEAVSSVLMTDIRAFTTLSEQADPSKVFTWLNEYFGKLVPIVVNHGGVVNKFDGDAMLAFFGILPRITNPRKSAMAACETAVEMMRAIDELNALRAQRREPVMVTGIGITTGVVIAGGLGSSDRLHYTIIGDTVNTASRLQGLTRELCSESAIIVGQTTLDALGEQQNLFLFEALGEHNVRGKAEILQVHRLHVPPRPTDRRL